MPRAVDKIVIVQRKTAMEELVERFGTVDQARFYVESLGVSFAEYRAEHDTYRRAAEALRAAIPRGVRFQHLDRSFLPTFLFGEGDLVVVLGRDGLVVNTAKYLNDQPVLAINPDPGRIDGVLLPFDVDEAPRALRLALSGEFSARRVSMARAELNDGQRLDAVNDLFIGHKSHGSARYRLTFDGIQEDQSSSGLIVSTGAGSTGWLRSILTGAAGVVASRVDLPEVAAVRDDYRFDWEADELVFHVREPFLSRTSTAQVVCGRIGPDDALELTSRMPRDGVIFSDGVEEDALDFPSGATALIHLADRKLHLLVADEPRRPV